MITIIGILFLIGVLYCLSETEIGCLGAIIVGILTVVGSFLLFLILLDLIFSFF